ncbi:alpha/beta hydrolase [Alsobacter soli]|uniref:Alpha/beta hydrolase n=1 Tax=Alsobacter soli TaxID=2109933 RepID=A0A2T1HVT6_9HYPH|nr:alpha/beta fold hydrolase [Alsobacter soli]PSC05776.1 alpha/beta hydrolase [Alsobacter soli]
MTVPLVFAPGLNCTAELFSRQAERFESERKVLFADTVSDATVAAMAGRLLASAPPQFALAGLSMGGYLALEVMRLAPRRVAALALLNTNARPDTDEGTQRRLRLMAMAEAGRFEAVHSAMWPTLVHPERRGDADLESVVRRMAMAVGPEAFARQQRACIGRMDSRPFLGAISAPTLVLTSEQDLLMPLETSQEMKDAIPGAELVIVPEAGHLSSLEQPELVSEALAAWLGRSGA